MIIIQSLQKQMIRKADKAPNQVVRITTCKKLIPISS